LRLAFRHLLAAIFTLLAIVFLCHLTLEAAEARGYAPASVVLCQSVVDTGEYLSHAIRGDLGNSALHVRRSRIMRNRPVAQLLRAYYPRSMGLLAAALLLTAFIGIPLGALTALQRHSRFSMGIIASTLVGISTPTFFLALLFQVGLIHFYRATGMRLLPVGGFGWDEHIVMPALVLAAPSIARLARMTYLALADVLEQDYIRTAYAKGLPRRRVVWHHAFPNAAPSILTALSLSMRYSLAALPVAEVFVGWPGVGTALLDAIRSYDVNTTTGLVLSLGLTFLLINALLELGYLWVDPRLRSAVPGGGA